jgi:DNA-binding transcriptional LysR family regulator
MPDSEITLDLLSRQRIVSRDLWLRQEIERLTAFKPAALVNNIHAKSFLIRTGHYIGFMPSNSAQDAVDRGDLRSIRPSEYQWSANYYLLTRAGVHRSPAGEAFLEDMRDAIKVSAKTS